MLIASLQKVGHCLLQRSVVVFLLLDSAERMSWLSIGSDATLAGRGLVVVYYTSACVASFYV